MPNEITTGSVHLVTGKANMTSIDEEIDQMNMKKLMNDQLTTYQVPWKPPNDYEALETNTVTGLDKQCF